MDALPTCLDCGATWDDRGTCEEHFSQMLVRDFEDPEAGAVHYLTVLCYYLQHPRLYSPEGLCHAQHLLIAFVVQGTPPQEIRRRERRQLDSGQRRWNITGRSEGPAAYDHPVEWTLRVADAATDDRTSHAERVRVWAQSVYDALKASGNLG